MTKRLGLVLGLLVAGCSDSTGPDIPRLNGSWSYAATNITGGGLTCSITGMTLTLSQTGNTVTGSTLGGRMSCQAGTLTETFDIAAGTLTGGSINGNVVRFSMGTTGAFQNTGTLTDNAISGQLVINLSDAVLAGTFVAARQ